MDFEKRLRRLETYLPADIVISVNTPEGTKRMSADEYVAAGGLLNLPLRVCSGRNLSDAKKILDAIPSVIE